tara:strand:+ start:220 stop:462 length:243 start_codon:yes stop_codon:yes gene_type:complete
MIISFLVSVDQNIHIIQHNSKHNKFDHEDEWNEYWENNKNRLSERFKITNTWDSPVLIGIVEGHIKWLKQPELKEIKKIY